MAVSFSVVVIFSVEYVYSGVKVYSNRVQSHRDIVWLYASHVWQFVAVYQCSWFGWGSEWVWDLSSQSAERIVASLWAAKYGVAFSFLSCRCLLCWFWGFGFMKPAPAGCAVWGYYLSLVYDNWHFLVRLLAILLVSLHQLVCWMTSAEYKKYCLNVSLCHIMVISSEQGTPYDVTCTNYAYISL